MDALPDIEIEMIRPTLDDLPRYELPAGYAFHWYEPGDEKAWTDIHLVSDLLNNITPTLFDEQFGDHADLLPERQCYLRDTSTGQLIATTSAWFSEHYQGGAWGRIHWVAMLPDYQGKGLSKPLLSIVCQRLKDLGHTRAYLDTSAARLPAVGLYLKFGFQPVVHTPDERHIWNEVLTRLNRPLL